MSIEVLLIPLAIAAISAATATKKGTEGRPQIEVSSRMRDGELLTESLRNLGAEVVDAGENHVQVRIGQRGMTMNRGQDGIWSAHFEPSWTEEEAIQAIVDLDQVYGANVQREVVRKLKERAPGAGFDIESESVDEAQTVTMVLTVGAGR